MSTVFADTYYFLALLNKHDEAHAKAVKCSALIDKLVTTEWILTELADGLASSSHRKMFLETRQELLADGQENCKIGGNCLPVAEFVRIRAFRPATEVSRLRLP